MPSAARQRLPADLWRHGQRKPSSGSPGPFLNSQEIQASPVHTDFFQEDKQHTRQGSKKNLIKPIRRHFYATERGSPKSLPQRGSADALKDALKDSDSSVDGSDPAVLSSSANSDSSFSYELSQESDAYAMESSIAPHPSQVPFPPLEWLQSSSRRSLSPAIVGISLQAILGCQIAA